VEFRDAVKAVFGKIKQRVGVYWREIGAYQSVFSPFNGQLYANEVCRACIRTLAEHTSKANAKVVNDKRLENLLNIRPNMYMNGKDFLYKCRTLYEIHNTLFIYINRDDAGKCIGLYPVPQCASEAIDVDGELFMKFHLPSGDTLTASWKDLAVLRKDYNSSDIYGDDNTAINSSLDLLNTAQQGMGNAIKSTANLRGILKSTKAMLSPEDAKMQKDRFVSDYLTMSNGSGIASLDATQEFKELNIQPQIANYKNVEELRNNIYRYYRTNEDAITNQLVGDKADSFYEGGVEPFLIAFSLELSYKIYTDRQRTFGNNITYESNRMQYMTIASKLALVQMVDRESMTINEWRFVMNLAPLPDGDRTISWQNPQKTQKVGEENANQNGQGISGNEPADPDSSGKAATK
jgi:HK97 family phage portal protein